MHFKTNQCLKSFILLHIKRVCSFIAHNSSTKNAKQRMNAVYCYHLTFRTRLVNTFILFSHSEESKAWADALVTKSKYNHSLQIYVLEHRKYYFKNAKPTIPSRITCNTTFRHLKCYHAILKTKKESFCLRLVRNLSNSGNSGEYVSLLKYTQLYHLYLPWS